MEKNESAPFDEDKALSFEDPDEEGEEEEGDEEDQEAHNHDESVIEEHIEYPTVANHEIDNSPALEVPDACVTAVEMGPTSRTMSSLTADEVTEEDLTHQHHTGYYEAGAFCTTAHGTDTITNSVEKKKKVKKKKKKVTKKVDKPSDHPASLPRIPSKDVSNAHGPVHEPQMIARATSESRIVRPASRSSSPQKLMDGEINIATYHPYHTVLVENAYVRPVVVTILIPEKLPGMNDNSSSSMSKGKKKLKKGSKKVVGSSSSKKSTDETSGEESANDHDRYDSTAEEDNSHVNAKKRNSGPTATTSSSSSAVDPNLLFALDIKHFRYLVVKVNDVVNSREAIYPIVLRDFRALLKELIQEYWTPSVGDYYRPNSLKWWAKYIKKIIVVFDRPTGQLSALVDKKAIRRIVKKKMEHHEWMKSTISSSQQQQRPVQVQTSIPQPPTQEGSMPLSSSGRLSNDVDPFSVTYKPENSEERASSTRGSDRIRQEVEGGSNYDSSVDLVDNNFLATGESGFDSKENFAVEAHVSGYSSLDCSEDEMGFQLTVESASYAVVLPTVAPESSSSRHRPQSKSSSNANKGVHHSKKPKSSSSAEPLPSIQKSHSTNHHGGSARAATAEKPPSAAEMRTNKLLSKAYAPLIPPYTQEEIEEMFAPKKKKRPMKQPKPIDSSLSGPASVHEDQSLQLSDASVVESFPALNTEDSNHAFHRSKDSTSLSPGFAAIHTEGSLSSLPRRPRSPFNEEISALKKPSEKLVANILVKARKAISASEEFQNRKITQSEIRLLDSPFAKKLYRDPPSTEAILKNLSIQS